MISGIHRQVDENCVFQGCYAASSGNSLPTFRENLSGLTHVWTTDWCPDLLSVTSARIYHYLLRMNPEERRSRLVILHHNMQRQCHQPDGSPTSVTWRQLPRKQTNISTPIYAHTTSRILRTRDFSLCSPTLLAPEAGIFVELILQYFKLSHGRFLTSTSSPQSKPPRYQPNILQFATWSSILIFSLCLQNFHRIFSSSLFPHIPPVQPSVIWSLPVRFYEK